jgi:hypothetical protein
MIDDPVRAARMLPFSRRGYDDGNVAASNDFLRSEAPSATLMGASNEMAWLAAACGVFADRPERLRIARAELADTIERLLDCGDLLDAMLAKGGS